MKQFPPLHVCALDIETSTIRKGSIESCELYIAGIKEFVLEGGYYKTGKYRAFFPKDIKLLETFLKQYPGIIIGHNLFNFDYRVLRSKINLRGIIEKSVDTFYFLYRKTGGYLNLSLDVLSYANYSMNKTEKSVAIPSLWKQGKRKRVMEYNKIDCILSMNLWWVLIAKREFNLGYIYKKHINPKPGGIVSSYDVQRLVGIRPQLTHQQWKKATSKDKWLVNKENWSTDPSNRHFHRLPIKSRAFDDRYSSMFRNLDHQWHWMTGLIFEF